VAVGLLKGAPLMRFFKANQPVLSEEDRARDLRLTAIATRYRARPHDFGEDVCADPPPAPELPQ